MAKTIFAVAVSVCIASLASSAQESDLNARLKALTALPINNADYRLGPGDLIEIRVFGVSNLDQTLRISASGTIKLPLIDTVKAEGLTSSELEQRLAAKLAGDVIKDPEVSVFVKEYRSQPVTVLGAVRNPGQILITLQLRIVDVLSLAGGLQPNAGDEATIQRRAKDGQEDEIIKVNLRELLERGDLSLNTVVRGGDTIHVQERLDRYVYVVGELNRGGAFPIPPKQEVRVSQVFAWAGGASRTAKVSDSLLLRYDAAGQRQEIKVNFSDILKGKKEDFLVQGNDIIFVPGSKIKSFAQNLLLGLPGAIQTIPYRIP
jgi:polysaccharide export outer membrane protein